MLRYSCLTALILMTHIAAAQSTSAYTDSRSDSRSYAVFGPAIGSPSGISLIAGYYFDPVALRVSGGYWGKAWNGAQGDIGITLSQSAWLAQGISFVAGMFKVNPIVGDTQVQQRQPKSERYMGLAYDAYLSGFFLQLGLGAGKGDYQNPQLLLQCGYLFQL